MSWQARRAACVRLWWGRHPRSAAVSAQAWVWELATGQAPLARPAQVMQDRRVPEWAAPKAAL